MYINWNILLPYDWPMSMLIFYTVLLISSWHINTNLKSNVIWDLCTKLNIKVWLSATGTTGQIKATKFYFLTNNFFNFKNFSPVHTWPLYTLSHYIHTQTCPAGLNTSLPACTAGCNTHLCLDYSQNQCTPLHRHNGRSLANSGRYLKSKQT